MNTAKAVNNFLEAKQRLSPRTLEQYSWALDYLQQECPKMPTKPEPIRKAINKLDTPWTAEACWRVWKCFFRWCSHEYRAPNIMEWVERPKTPDIEMRYLEPEELALVLAAADDLRDKTLLALGLDAGIRASEFGRLRILDVGTDTLWVWGKGNKRVRVPISPDTRHLLDLLIKSDGHHGPQSLVFPGHDGQPMSRFAVYRITRCCMDRAGIAGPKRGPHCLRHSLGTNYIADGGDPFSLKRIMRHSNISTTQKYVNLAMHTVVAMHNLHSPLRQALRGAQGVLIKREVEEIIGEDEKKTCDGNAPNK